MWVFIKKHNIAVQLLVLIITLSSLSVYNLVTQRELLLQQMELDSQDVIQSITSSLQRFQDIKSTMSVEKLVRDISLGLEIFEFRYLDQEGIVRNSMFHDEIGKKFTRESFLKALAQPHMMDKFYFDERDYVPVMAITYPVKVEDRQLGIIDLSVDISEYNYVAGQQPEFALTRRQVDIRNLLRAITGSIHNSVEIFETVEINAFLSAYVSATRNIRQISIVSANGTILASSDFHSIGKTVDARLDGATSTELIESGGELIYRIITPNTQFVSDNGSLLLMLDAAPYAANERRLIYTAIGTSALTILFAAFIAYSIYTFNLTQARMENIRLEGMVRERTREIEILSKTDALTGLWNRGHLEEHLEAEFARAKRYDNELTVLMLDLDHFKHINDTYGHLAGDEVLREAAKRVRKTLRESDFVGRYGGEEIMVILPETGLLNAQVVGEKLRKVIAEATVEFDGNEIPITTSIGISAFHPRFDKAQKIIEAADEALYQSKANGRNRVTVIDPGASVRAESYAI
ncbi:MAG: GGDEF domain-containing protein [Pseudomonadota bacterium]